MFKEHFREKIKRARIDAGYTQRQVAEELDTSHSKIAQIESGRIEPNIETIGKLAEFYGVSVSWLFGMGEKDIPGEPVRSLIDDFLSGTAIIAFLATFSKEDIAVFFSGKMKFSKFLESKQFQKLPLKQQIQIYQDYQNEKWKRANESQKILDELKTLQT